MKARKQSELGLMAAIAPKAWREFGSPGTVKAVLTVRSAWSPSELEMGRDLIISEVNALLISPELYFLPKDNKVPNLRFIFWNQLRWYSEILLQKDYVVLYLMNVKKNIFYKL